MSGDQDKASKLGLAGRLRKIEETAEPSHFKFPAVPESEAKSASELANGPDFSAEKREINTDIKAFGTNFGHTFDTGQGSSSASTHIDEGNENEKDKLLHICQQQNSTEDNGPKSQEGLEQFKFQNQATSGDDHPTHSRNHSGISIPLTEDSFDNVDNNHTGGSPISTPSEGVSMDEKWHSTHATLTQADTAEDLIVEQKPQEPSFLVTPKRQLRPGDLLPRTLESPERILQLIQQNANHWKDLISFSDTFIKAMNSGSQTDKLDCVKSPSYRILLDVGGKSKEVIPDIDLDIIDELNAIVGEISATSIEELADRCPSDRSVDLIAQTTFKSFAPFGGLAHKKNISLWVLCRGTGFLKLTDLETLHTLSRVAEEGRSTFKKREQYNTKGKWYGIHGRRLLLKEAFIINEEISNIPGAFDLTPGPLQNVSSNKLQVMYALAVGDGTVASYQGFTKWATDCRRMQDIIRLETLRRGSSKTFETIDNPRENGFTLIKGACASAFTTLRDNYKECAPPIGWLEGYDRYGRTCWISMENDTFVYKQPEALYCSVSNMMQAILATAFEVKSSLPNGSKKNLAASSSSKPMIYTGRPKGKQRKLEN
ncbi:hypothetical protein VTL71DRAFT_16288 [Oculimacula yallundae]|uniref:Uncharacterized protein n=1 Tax=Oculimacula yallundae TaxID=86028 RepID=A0ABR4CE26_9HELO